MISLLRLNRRSDRVLVILLLIIIQLNTEPVAHSHIVRAVVDIVSFRIFIIFAKFNRL